MGWKEDWGGQVREERGGKERDKVEDSQEGRVGDIGR